MFKGKNIKNLKKFTVLWQYESDSGKMVCFDDLQCFQLNIWQDQYRRNPINRILKIAGLTIDFQHLTAKKDDEVRKIIKSESIVRKREETNSRVSESAIAQRLLSRHFDK